MFINVTPFSNSFLKSYQIIYLRFRRPKKLSEGFDFKFFKVTSDQTPFGFHLSLTRNPVHVIRERLFTLDCIPVRIGWDRWVVQAVERGTPAGEVPGHVIRLASQPVPEIVVLSTPAPEFVAEPVDCLVLVPPNSQHAARISLISDPA